GILLEMKPCYFIVLTLVLTLLHPARPCSGTESVIKTGGIEFGLVTIRGGTFDMGSDSGDGDERPIHKVTINYSFDIGTTEVTVGQFKAFVNDTGYKTVAEQSGGSWLCPCPDRMGGSKKLNWQNPGFEQTDNHPVVTISYNDAKAFCKWLSEKSGENFRLPTEAEWEYACRGSTTGDYAGKIKEMAWFEATSKGKTHPVAQKKPNNWGLYDMGGNVWEWCEDIYHWHYRNAPNDGSANTFTDVGADIAWRRVLRGGSWCRPDTSCTPTYRYAGHRTFCECGTGFRVVRCNRSATPAGRNLAGIKQKRRKSDARKAPAKLTLTVDDIGFDFVRIDPGTFVMGSPRVYVDMANMAYEMPAHKVTIDYVYYMAATEVTLEQFELFVEDTGYVTDAEKHGWALLGDQEWQNVFLSDLRYPGFVQTETEPVTHISYYDAIAFCTWLNERTGREVRLPSESEWEYACRASTTGNYAGDLYEMGWHRWNANKRTSPVARKKPNPWGLYDMHGNVWEWVQDLWHDDCNNAPTDGSPWLDATGRGRVGVTRGGSFGAPPWLCRSYSRMWTLLSVMVNQKNGFRIAMAFK
ncbi:MAG: formylglycine-generating enzyme family protein, partial [Planctomycetota bacterium]